MVTGLEKSNIRIMPDWPKRGYYVELSWLRIKEIKEKRMHTTVGPFPESKMDLLVEFLNTVEAMVDCEGHPDNYEKIPGYGKWFRTNNYDAPLGLLIETPYDDTDVNKEYRLYGYAVYYHDGLSLTAYYVNTNSKEAHERYDDPESAFLQELPQYHFERSMFTRTFNEILGSTLCDVVEDLCTEHGRTSSFTFDRNDDEFYVIHRRSGTIINWYKHLGRTNTCNKPGFGIDDLEEMLLLLKKEISG